MATSPAMPINTVNRCMVSASGDRIILLRPPARLETMTHDEALTLAAWLVALADGPAIDEGGQDHSRGRFEQILEAVRNT